MSLKAIWGAIAAVAALSVAVQAQTASKTIKGPLNETLIIQAISPTDRLITFRNEKGEERTVYAGPEVKRFAELKVGQKVQIRYYESVVATLARADQKTEALKAASAVTPGTGPLPGGTVARQMTATVDIVNIDLNVPSITVKGASGGMVTRKVENPKLLEGFKAGDRVTITYTEAALIEVM